jgi:hypothetical protein
VLELNGWRRLGLVAIVLWILGTVALASTEVASSSDGFFIYRGIPIGTTVDGETATLPSGETVKINARDASGRLLEPWEIDWEAQTQVPTVSEIRWWRLALFAFAVPIGAWVLVELLALVVVWVARGFKDRKA